MRWRRSFPERVRHLLERLAHGGQRRIGQGGVGDVVEADHRDVVRDAAAEKAQRLESADRHWVVRDEDRVHVGHALGERRCTRRAGIEKRCRTATSG
jgi:hypothetical protein